MGIFPKEIPQLSKRHPIPLFRSHLSFHHSWAHFRDYIHLLLNFDVSWIIYYIDGVLLFGMCRQLTNTHSYHSQVRTVPYPFLHWKFPKSVEKYIVVSYIKNASTAKGQVIKQTAKFKNILIPNFELDGSQYTLQSVACICSAQSGSLRNLEIALCILRILRLRSNLEIAHYSCAISRLHNYCAQSSDCANYACTL